MDLVVFSDDWGRRPSAPQHLVAELARRHRVLWVEPAGLRAPRLRRDDLARAAEKVVGWAGRPSSAHAPWIRQPPSLHRLVPPLLPLYGLGPVRRINDRVLAGLVRRTVARLGFEDPVLLTTIPTVEGAIRRLAPWRSLWWRVDDFASWPGYDARAIEASEARLLTHVGGVVASCAALLPHHERRAVLPHGVDSRHFGAPAPRPARLPTGRPLLVVAGRLDERIDQLAVLGALDRLPTAHLLLLGEDVSIAAALRDHPRVSLRDAVPYAELPGWLRAADVLLAPYALDALGHTLAPLKLREYLATGVPVVCAPIAGALGDPEVADHLRFASTGSEMAAAIADALAEAAHCSEGRRAAAGAMAWARRATDLEALIALLPSAPS